MRRGSLGRTTVCAATVALVIVAHGVAGSAGLLPRCHTPQLRVAATFRGAAAGEFVQTFTLTNVSGSACSLRGWPRLAVESRSGHPMRTSVRRVVQGAPTAPPFRTVVLRPRAVGAFDVYGADWNAAANKSCPRTTAVLVTPPSARSAVSVAVRMTNCRGFYIAPVIAGSVDRQAWSVVWH